VHLEAVLGAVGPRGSPQRNYYLQLVRPVGAEIIVSVSLTYAHKGQVQVR
jgi:hypothetical protein